MPPDNDVKTFRPRSQGVSRLKQGGGEWESRCVSRLNKGGGEWEEESLPVHSDVTLASPLVSGLGGVKC